MAIFWKTIRIFINFEPAGLQFVFIPGFLYTS